MKSPDKGILQQRLEQRLARYVAMPTIATHTAACKEAIQAIAGELNSIGFKTHINDSRHPWVMATTRNTKHVRVLLHAHFDVVTASDKNFVMRTDGNKLVGRGVFDMKFALTSYMEAITDILQQDELSAYDLGVLVTTDEEIGGEHGVMEFLEQGWSCDVAIIPDGGRDFKIEQRAKGFDFFFLDSHGTSTHGSRPWEGVNPLPNLLPAVQEIISHYDENDDPSGPTVSINGIDTPGSFSQVGALARARIDVRAFEREELNQIEKYLTGVAKKHSLTITKHLTGSPVYLDLKNPLVQSFVECQTEARGEPVEFTESLGASDARYFANKGIPTIVEYPHGGNAHSEGEWLDRDSLVQFYEVIKLYVERTALDRAGAPVASRLLATPKKVMRSLLNR